MLGLSTGYIQPWGASDRVICAAGSKARSKAQKAQGWISALRCPSSMEGASPFPCQSATDRALLGTGLLQEVTCQPCFL